MREERRGFASLIQRQEVNLFRYESTLGEY